jgi:hypothetical protein
MLQSTESPPMSVGLYVVAPAEMLRKRAAEMERLDAMIGRARNFQAKIKVVRGER